MEHVHVKKIMKEKKKQVLFQAEIRKVWYIWWISSTPSGKERVWKDPTSWSNQRNFFTFLWILTVTPKAPAPRIPPGCSGKEPFFPPVFIIERSGKRLQGNPPRAFIIWDYSHNLELLMLRNNLFYWFLCVPWSPSRLSSWNQE